MMTFRHDTTARLLLALLVTLPFAGCGNGGGAAKAQAAKGIYTNSVDCAEGGKLTFEQCAQALDAAVTEHEKTAPTYTALWRCEETEGVNKCEHTHAGRFRPKLLAFLVIATDPPVATPLYAPPKGKAGFRGADSKLYLEKDETITFSEHAQTQFEAHLDKRKVRH